MRKLFEAKYLDFAVRVARLRTTVSRKRNYNPTTHSGEASGSYDPDGALGEVFMHYIETDQRYEFIPEGSFKTKRDYGPLEIQTVMGWTRRLIMRPQDLARGVPANTPYVLVRFTTGNDGQVYGEAVGWYRLGEGLEHPERVPYQEIYYLPDSVLRPMTELWAILNDEGTPAIG